MTDDRSLERAARSWLEEGPTQAPDRPVDAALSRIQTTRQERGSLVPWRLPTMSTPARVLAAAALVAVVGFGAIVAITRPLPGPGSTPSPMHTTTVSAAPTQTSIEAYRAARDELCIGMRSPAGQLRTRVLLVWDGSITAAQRADWIDALRSYGGLYDVLITNLGELEPPAELVQEHATNIADFQTIRAMIATTADHLEAGEDALAQAVDAATDPIGQRIKQWEIDNGLAICP
jgi:hypothetical protein